MEVASENGDCRFRLSIDIKYSLIQQSLRDPISKRMPLSELGYRVKFEGAFLMLDYLALTIFGQTFCRSTLSKFICEILRS
jgi:hypothetical protein